MYFFQIFDFEYLNFSIIFFAYKTYNPFRKGDKLDK